MPYTRFGYVTIPAPNIVPIGSGVNKAILSGTGQPIGLFIKE